MQITNVISKLTGQGGQLVKPEAASPETQN
jgi:hypothetical protein